MFGHEFPTEMFSINGFSHPNLTSMTLNSSSERVKPGGTSTTLLAAFQMNVLSKFLGQVSQAKLRQEADDRLNPAIRAMVLKTAVLKQTTLGKKEKVSNNQVV